MKTIEEYVEVIGKVRRAAGGQSLAQWELVNYGKQR